MTRYFMVRKVGTEEYFEGKLTAGVPDWGPMHRGKLYNKRAVISWIKWAHNNDDFNFDEVEIVAYDLLEQLTYTPNNFYNKHGKSPLLSM